MQKKQNVPEKQPEKFSMNLKYLFKRYKNIQNFSQTNLSKDYLHLAPTKLSKYINGNSGVSNLDEDQYTIIAKYILSNICNNQEKTRTLCELAGLECFNYSQLKNKKSSKQIIELFENAMKDRVFGSPTINNYSVRFVDWDGAELWVESVAYGESATIPDDPTRAGYEFDGWDVEFDNITRDLTVSAQYSKSVISKSNGKSKSKGNSSSNRSESKKGLSASKSILIIFAAVALVVAIVLYSIDSWHTVLSLSITYCSPIGERNSYIKGTVTFPEGSPSDYAVTLAIVSPTDGQIYAPIPSSDNPSVPVITTEKSRVGSFTCTFAPEASPDAYTNEIFIYVVPADFIPNEDVERTANESIIRTIYLR
jgi:hypothetical protein